MKKSILLLIPLMMSLVACNNSSSINNQEDVNNLKSILKEQDLSPLNKKLYFSQFSQNFSVYTNELNDEGKRIDFFNYNGSGNVGYYYDVDEKAYEEIIKDENTNIFDIMCQGLGYYTLIQYATINSFINDESEEIEHNDRYTYIQQLGALFSDSNLQITNEYLFSDFNDDEGYDYRQFNGAIAKDILFDSYSTKTLSDIFSRVNIYDGPGYCETIDSMYYQTVLSLSQSTDKEISDFIINNNIECVESDRYLELSFELKEDKYINQLIDNDIIPGAIKGTLFLDKETKQLEEFKYRIIYFEEEVDQSNNYVHVASMEFEVDGESSRDISEVDPSMSDEPTVFTDPDEFMRQVVEQALPSIAK